jgi:predicted DNA-binding transcriptional regulator AlpA
MIDEATMRHSPHGKRDHESGEFLSDQQLADMLGVTTRTTLRWRRDGAGPSYVRAGLRRVLYRRSDVLAWAAARTFPTLAAESVAKFD